MRVFKLQSVKNIPTLTTLRSSSKWQRNMNTEISQTRRTWYHLKIKTWSLKTPTGMKNNNPQCL